jgi:division protein CdvB (Snf7/Vps24/ESCRT-III family)
VSDLAELRRRVNQVDSDVSSIYEMISEVRSVQRRHTSQLDNLAGRLDDQGTKLDEHSAKLDEHSAKLDEHSAKLDEILRLLQSRQ